MHLLLMYNAFLTVFSLILLYKGDVQSFKGAEIPAHLPDLQIFCEYCKCECGEPRFGTLNFMFTTF